MFDLSRDSQDNRHHQSSSPERDRNSRPNSPKIVSEDRSPGRDRKPSQPNMGNTRRRHNSPKTSNLPFSCFICDGSHRAKECLNKSAFYAFQASLASDLDDKSSQSKKKVGQVDGVENPRVRAMSSCRFFIRKWGRQVNM